MAWRPSFPQTTIQILYCFGADLATYFSKFEAGHLELPDFAVCCPLCRARGCAVFLGYHRRAVVLEKGKVVPDFPIARYRCRRRGARANRHPHVTFSLLPHEWVPYARFSLPHLERVIELYRKSNGDLDTFLRPQGLTALAALEEALALWTAADGKLKATRRSWPELSVPATSTRAELLGKFWMELVGFTDVPDYRMLRGLSARGLDFYHRGGSWQLEAHFLWGTPSQFRLR